MAYSNLQTFITALEAAGELKRIAAQVNPVLEVTEITDRISKTQGPALLFEKVKGSDFPLLINVFGSTARMCLALNCSSFDEIAGKIESYLKMQPPQGLVGKIKTLLTLKDVARIMTKRKKAGRARNRFFPLTARCWICSLFSPAGRRMPVRLLPCPW